MYAITQEVTGGPETLVWGECPEPEAQAGEVILDVAASAVNRADLLQRQGLYPPPPGVSPILGLECSGIVRKVGPGVTGLEPGDRVTALLSGGGYAERVAVPAGLTMPVPTGLEIETAASLPEAACTVWSNIRLTANLNKGEWVLIHGGGSGIGTMAIQVAHALGARVMVTAGSQAKLDVCASLGAEVLVNYKEQDFVEVAREATDGNGVDVILDNMGAAYLNRNVAALGRNGRLCIIGLQGGTRGELDLNAQLRKNVTIHATSLRGRPLAEKFEICRSVERHIWPWVESGVIRPIVDHVLPMREASVAHHELETGSAIGKIVLINDSVR